MSCWVKNVFNVSGLCFFPAYFVLPPLWESCSVSLTWSWMVELPPALNWSRTCPIERAHFPVLLFLLQLFDSLLRKEAYKIWVSPGCPPTMTFMSRWMPHQSPLVFLWCALWTTRPRLAGTIIKDIDNPGSNPQTTKSTPGGEGLRVWNCNKHSRDS